MYSGSPDESGADSRVHRRPDARLRPVFEVPHLPEKSAHLCVTSALPSATRHRRSRASPQGSPCRTSSASAAPPAFRCASTGTLAFGRFRRKGASGPRPLPASPVRMSEGGASKGMREREAGRANGTRDAGMRRKHNLAPCPAPCSPSLPRSLSSRSLLLTFDRLCPRILHPAVDARRGEDEKSRENRQRRASRTRAGHHHLIRSIRTVCYETRAESDRAAFFASQAIGTGR
jgi:hypothetical protein